MRTIVFAVATYLAIAIPARAIEYPGKTPQNATGTADADQLILANEVIRCRWDLDSGKVSSVLVTDLQIHRTLAMNSGHMPRIVFSNAAVVDLAVIEPESAYRLEDLSPDASSAHGEAQCGGKRLRATFLDQATGMRIRWTAELRDGSNYITQAIRLTGTNDAPIKELIFLDALVEGARQVGQVDGSVVVCGNLFLAVEHPLAKNTVDKDSHVRCALPRGNVLRAGKVWQYTSVLGTVPQNQMRRGFLYYLQRRRAHPFRPFLHYNSWYHLNIGRPDNHMTESECSATIEYFGRELIEQRGGRMDAFVWDDGWDDFNTLWGFHKDFPHGFETLKKAGEKYNAAQGVWMSPWGGYGGPKNKRLAFGKSQGYETNKNGFSMAGLKYRAAFRNVCLKMIRENGVVFFKFDGMGAGGGTRAPAELADDVDSVLNLTSDLRKESPQLFISATVGTWASPFWTLYADSIWRQGGDTGFHGPGNERQRWLTYRDMFCYRCIVQWGPLYPLNSLMLHGPCIGERANPAKMSRDEKSVADEFWSFFGSGTNLQELYISPHLLTPKMWDELAAATKWSRANSDVLCDTHWIGGNPRAGDVYGWASWQPRNGFVTLRNPSEKPQAYALELAHDLALPDQYLTDYVLTSVRPNQRIRQVRAASVEPVRVELQPFEVLVFEVARAPGAEQYNAKSYRQRCSEREAARARIAREAFQGGGVWEYLYQARTYQRRFLPGGDAHLYVDGKRSDAWQGFTWRIEDTRLIVDKPDGSNEEHCLDNQGRLLLPAGLGTARKVQ